MGLAIGFTAFVFTLSWIRYEGYDSLTPCREDIPMSFQYSQVEGVTNMTPRSASYLMKNFPEVEAATSIFYKTNLNLNEKAFLTDVHIVAADTFSFRFYPEIRISCHLPFPKQLSTYREHC